METREKIRTQFIQLVTESGFAKTRISHLCAAMGIQRKLFYYYFDDKYELLATVYENDLTQYFGSQRTTMDNWQAQSLALFRTYRQRGNFYKHAIIEDANLWDQLFSEHMHQLFIKLFQELSVDPQRTAVTFYADFYANGWHGVIKKWILNDFDQDEQDLIHQFDTLITFTKNSLKNWSGTKTDF